MKAEELRIGNWVNTVKGHRQCIDVLCDSINFQDIQNEIYDDIEPIHLTDDWLVRFGFKITSNYHPEGKTYELGELRCTEFYNYVSYKYVRITRNEIKSVHQLQNLYFALTGEELTIK